MTRDISSAVGRSTGRPGRCRIAYLALAAAFLLAAARGARAEVVGTGDVTPAAADPDTGIVIPDLPIAGGEVDGTITVGGTGQMVLDTDTGALLIDAPGTTDPLISNKGVIGGTAVGSGIVTIVSAGSQWRISDGPEGLIVGQEGQGTLTLSSGGQVSDDPTDAAGTDLEVIVGQVSGSQGFVNITGNGSLLRSQKLTIGQEGFGQLTMNTGARVETLQNAIIGDVGTGLDVGTGFVTVNGSNGALTRWTIGGSATGATTQGNLVVGKGGRGSLSITNQGEVRVTNPAGTGGEVIIGDEAGSLGEVVVNGAFSQLWAFGGIAISDADGGSGILRIQNAALVRANEGVTIGANGVLELSGGSLFTPTTSSGKVTNSGVIRTAVGNIGQIDSIVDNASLGEIRTAGTVDRVRERLLFTRTVGNHANALITSIGGEMEFVAPVTNDLGGTISGRDAIYRFRGGLTNSGILGFSVGVSDVYGVVNNSSGGVIGVANRTEVTFYDDVANSGEISVLPGGSAIFLQDLNFSASSLLSVHLNEVANVAQLAQLDIVGNTVLDGNLKVFADADLDPKPGDSFQIMSGTNITGMFSSVEFPPAPGRNWSIVYSPDSVILNYLAAPSFNGDFNGDGVVDGADLGIWRTHVGTMPVTMADGDADGDGDVDGNDFMIWQRTRGPVTAVAAVGAVPEPGAVALALAAFALVVRPRGRRSNA